MINRENISTLNRQFQDASPEELLRYFLGECGNKIALSSSLSLEDQVLTHILVNIDPKARIFTLDTGRLFPETYNLIDRTNMTYNINISVFFPNNEEVEKMVNEEGINLFFNSIESRHRCCGVRKLEPLKRAFQGLEAWICGLRQEQSVTRRDMQLIEWDEMHNMVKINPLINWTEERVWAYIRQHGIPYNKLHDKDYPSIGCEPCTRAVKKGDDIRSGRWWWESPEHRECGLHKKD